MISRRSRADAFTLIEILLASMGAALVLAALYGIFIHAVKLRDTATERVRDARLRARAESVIRADLRGAYISGGTLAATLEGGTNDNGGPGGASLPGYLKFTTTTGRDTGTDLFGDVQQVEYYLAADPAAPPAGGKSAGILVRALTRDLISTTTTTATTPAHEEQILRGVQSWTVEFYDGSNWQQTWNYDSAAAALTNGGSENSGTVITTGNTSLPDAVRIQVQPAAATPNGHLPPLVKILVPWATQPFAATTPSPNSFRNYGTPNNPPGGSRNGQGTGGSGTGGPTGGPGNGSPGGNPPPSGPPPSGPPPAGPPPGGPPPTGGSRTPR